MIRDTWTCCLRASPPLSLYCMSVVPEPGAGLSLTLTLSAQAEAQASGQGQARAAARGEARGLGLTAVLTLARFSFTSLARYSRSSRHVSASRARSVHGLVAHGLMHRTAELS